MEEKTVLQMWEEELKPALLWYMFSSIIKDSKITLEEFTKKFNEEKIKGEDDGK